MYVYENYVIMGVVEWVVNFMQQVGCFVVVGVYYNMVWFYEIIDGCFFFQEFWVGNYVEFQFKIVVIQFCVYCRVYFVGCVYGYCGFVYYNFIVVYILINGMGNCGYILQVGGVIFIGWGVDSNELQSVVFDCFFGIGCE